LKLRLESYARAIHEFWARSQQRAVILSPREWDLICGWFAREIPLQIVADAIEGLGEKKRGRTAAKPRSLSYLAPAVEESWSAVVNGRVEARAVQAAESDAGGGRAAWLAAAARCGEDSALAGLLRRLVQSGDAGAAPDEIERELNESLIELAPQEIVASLREEIAEQTAEFRERMRPAAIEAVERRALLERLRGRLGLPRYSMEPNDDRKR